MQPRALLQCLLQMKIQQVQDSLAELLRVILTVQDFRKNDRATCWSQMTLVASTVNKTRFLPSVPLKSCHTQNHTPKQITVCHQTLSVLIVLIMILLSQPEA